MVKSGRNSLAVLAIAGLGLTLTACGGGDDDAAPAATTDGGGDNNTAITGDNNTDTGDTVKVNDINDIPDKCVDLVTQLLKNVEPLVKDVDWKNATVSDMEDVGSQIDTEFSSLDDEMSSSGCDKYQLDDADSIDSLIDLAKDKAPGTVAFLEFVKNMSANFGTSGDSGGDNGGGNATDVPQDCQGAINYFKDLMDKYDSVTDMPVTEAGKISGVMSVISSKCSTDDVSALMTDPKVDAWLGG